MKNFLIPQNAEKKAKKLRAKNYENALKDRVKPSTAYVTATTAEDKAKAKQELEVIDKIIKQTMPTSEKEKNKEKKQVEKATKRLRI